MLDGQHVALIGSGAYEREASAQLFSKDENEARLGYSLATEDDKAQQLETYRQALFEQQYFTLAHPGVVAGRVASVRAEFYVAAHASLTLVGMHLASAPVVAVNGSFITARSVVDYRGARRSTMARRVQPVYKYLCAEVYFTELLLSTPGMFSTKTTRQVIGDNCTAPA